MNALVGIRSNSAGFLSATRAKRAAAAKEIQSNALAAQQSLQAKTMVAKSAKASSSSSSTTTSGSTLDKDSFLQLLVQQMQAQDPMNPTDSTQMVSQLAQFSALEQMTNLNDTVTAMSGNIDQSNFLSAASMLGKQVTGIDINKKSVSGTVSEVQMSGSVVYLTVGDQVMSMAGVSTIGEAST